MSAELMTASAWPRVVGGDGERDGGAADMELDFGLGFEEPRSEGRGEREQRKARHQGGLLILGQGAETAASAGRAAWALALSPQWRKGTTLLQKKKPCLRSIF